MASISLASNFVTLWWTHGNYPCGGSKSWPWLRAKALWTISTTILCSHQQYQQRAQPNIPPMAQMGSSAPSLDHRHTLRRIWISQLARQLGHGTPGLASGKWQALQEDYLKSPMRGNSSWSSNNSSTCGRRPQNPWQNTSKISKACAQPCCNPLTSEW